MQDASLKNIYHKKSHWNVFHWNVVTWHLSFGNYKTKSQIWSQNKSTRCLLSYCHLLFKNYSMGIIATRGKSRKIIRLLIRCGNVKFAFRVFLASRINDISCQLCRLQSIGRDIKSSQAVKWWIAKHSGSEQWDLIICNKYVFLFAISHA